MHDWARTVAIARLLLPCVRIGFGGGIDPAEFSLWWRAGGGNQVFALHAFTMKLPPEMSEHATPLGDGVHLVDRRPILARYLAALGLQATFDDPDATPEAAIHVCGPRPVRAGGKCDLFATQ